MTSADQNAYAWAHCRDCGLNMAGADLEARMAAHREHCPGPAYRQGGDAYAVPAEHPR